MIRALYSAALFEINEASVKEYGIIASSGVTNITPAPALNFQRAPSKYICHVDWTTVAVKTSSSGKSSSMGKSSGMDVLLKN